jgi:hypothetical protein
MSSLAAHSCGTLAAGRPRMRFDSGKHKPLPCTAERVRLAGISVAGGSLTSLDLGLGSPTMYVLLGWLRRPRLRQRCAQGEQKADP